MNAPFSMSGTTYRSTPHRTDRGEIRRMTVGTGFFSPVEIAIAVELVDDRLSRGMKSDYRFLLAEREGRLTAYTCFGRIDGTLNSYDLYWIVVRSDMQGKGLGREILRRTEAQIRRSKGGRIYVDTSSRDQYVSTRAFYETCGYRRASILPDFYAPGDGKIIYVKPLSL